MHPVLELIHQRAVEGSQPGGRTDGRRLGLVVEGGGMRGVVSGGMLTALEHLGLAVVFDAVYGSSAGAINGAYFVARGAGVGISIYYQEINNRRFIDPFRALVGRPVMSLDYLLDEVMIHVKPLDWRSVIKSPVRLKIVATSLARGGTVILDEYDSQRRLFDCLRASATMPFLAGGPVKLNGELFIDAAVYESIPFRTALADGCSDVLALLTRPAGVRRAGPSLAERLFLIRRLDRLRPGLKDDYHRRAWAYAEGVACLNEATGKPAGPPHLFAVSPPAGAAMVSRMEKNQAKLIQGAAGGARALAKALGRSPDGAGEVETLFSVNP